MISLVIGLIAAVLVPFNLRRARFAALARSLPDSLRRDVLAKIDSVGRKDGTPVLLLRPEALPDSLRLAHAVDPLDPVVGARYSNEVARRHGIIAQIVLQTPHLPRVWANRRVCLRLQDDHDITATSDTEPLDAKVRLRNSPTAGTTLLTGLSLPRSGANDIPPYDPTALCRRVPSVRDLLTDCTSRPDRLLPYILIPGIDTYEIATHLVSLMGGEPELIQNEHDAKCFECRQPMRFLLQLGDGLGLAGDAPVVYVYGCDAHVARVRAFVDTH